MTRPAATDRLRKATTRSQPRKVALAKVTTTYDTQHPTAAESTCSCGAWSFFHKRTKVREDAIQRHLDKHHGGVALWL